MNATERLIAQASVNGVVDPKTLVQLVITECLYCCERVIQDPCPEVYNTWLEGVVACMEEIEHNFGIIGPS